MSSIKGETPLAAFWEAIELGFSESADTIDDITLEIMENFSDAFFTRFSKNSKIPMESLAPLRERMKEITNMLDTAATYMHNLEKDFAPVIQPVVTDEGNAVQ